MCEIGVLFFKPIHLSMKTNVLFFEPIYISIEFLILLLNIFLRWSQLLSFDTCFCSKNNDDIGP